MFLILLYYQTMITVLYRELLPAIASTPVGLSVHAVEGHEGFILAIKAPKEFILTAKINRGFRVYVVPIESDGIITWALMTAFMDDESEPLYLFTPLFADEATSAILQLLSSETFDVHFFDEKNHEFLAYRAENKGAETMLPRIANARFWPLSYEKAQEYYAKASAWFSHRTPKDDAEALAITLDEPLFPENIFIQDTTIGQLATDAPDLARHFTLERGNDPGPYQERDLVHLLRRTFPAEQVFLNPHKADDDKEFVDVAVITPDSMVLIQAKDSPNTEKSLRRSIDRKRATLEGHLRKAVAQLGGALSYIRARKTMTLIGGNAERHAISIEGRKVIGLVVLKEIIGSEYAALSAPLLELARDTGVPCILMSYFEFHQFMHHRHTESSLLLTLQRTFDFAVQHNQFPFNRFGFVPDSE